MFMALKLGLEPKAMFLLIVNELCHFFGKAKKEFWLNTPWSALSCHTSLCGSMGCCLLASNHMTGSQQVVSIVLHLTNNLNELCHFFGKAKKEFWLTMPWSALSHHTPPCGSMGSCLLLVSWLQTTWLAVSKLFPSCCI